MRISINLIQPNLNIVKTFLICYIVNYNDSMSATIKSGSYCSKPFLSCSVPQLQFDYFPVKLQRVDLEIYTDRGIVAIAVGIVRKSKQKARLSHPSVPNNEKLEQIITAQKIRT